MKFVDKNGNELLVNKYIATQDQVDAGLDKLVKDGSLNAVSSSKAESLQKSINDAVASEKLLNSRLSTAEKALTDKATGDVVPEIQDARIGFDGTTYDTVGDAMREGLKTLSSKIATSRNLHAIREIGGPGVCRGDSDREERAMANIIERAVRWAEGIAADPAHGYDQTHRWGPDYDCASLVISAYKQAGVHAA